MKIRPFHASFYEVLEVYDLNHWCRKCQFHLVYKTFPQSLLADLMIAHAMIEELHQVSTTYHITFQFRYVVEYYAPQCYYQHPEHVDSIAESRDLCIKSGADDS